eukprot:374493-Rhodomonas_salina.2
MRGTEIANDTGAGRCGSRPCLVLRKRVLLPASASVGQAELLRPPQVPAYALATCIRACYAMSGTDSAYGTARPL